MKSPALEKKKLSTQQKKEKKSYTLSIKLSTKDLLCLYQKALKTPDKTPIYLSL